MHQFLGNCGVFQKEFVFVTNGDFDLMHIATETEVKNVPLRNYLMRWINLKKAWPGKLFPNPGAKKQVLYDFENANQIYEAKKPVIDNVQSMLKVLDLEMEGKQGAAIDDCLNISRCIIRLLQADFTFT